MRRYCLVTLNYNQGDLTKMFVNSHLMDFELIVVIDNNSTDDSFEVLDNAFKNNEKVVLIRSNKNNGYASGNNIGLQFVMDNYDYDLIFLINPDVIFDKNVINECIYVFNNPDVGVVSPRMMDYKMQKDISCWCFPNFYHHAFMNLYFYRKGKRYNVNIEPNEYKNMPVDVVRGSFMCLSSKALNKTGLFDEKTFLYNEENIICYKMKKNNYEVRVINNIYYIHNHPPKKNSNIKSLIKHNRNSTYYYFVKYQKINLFKRIIWKLLVLIGNIENVFIDFIKKRRKRND